MQKTCFYKKISTLFIVCFSLIIFAQKVLTDDIGLRIYNGNETIGISTEPLGTLTSPLRIAKDGNIYGIELVNPGDTDESGIRIQTSSGIKALKKYVPLPTAYVSLSMWSKRAFSTWYDVFVNVTVTENTSSGVPIVGATVQGTWSGDIAGTSSGTTNASGLVTLKSPDWVGVNQSATFTVNTITMGSDVYNLAGTLSQSYSP